MSFILTVNLGDALPGDIFFFFFSSWSMGNWRSTGCQVASCWDSSLTSTVHFSCLFPACAHVHCLDSWPTGRVYGRLWGGFIGFCCTVLLLFPPKTNLRHMPHIIFAFYHWEGPQEGAALHFEHNRGHVLGCLLRFSAQKATIESVFVCLILNECI